MMILEGKDDKGHPVLLTLTESNERHRAGSPIKALRLFRPTPGKGRFTGEELASFVLTESQNAELKRNL